MRLGVGPGNSLLGGIAVLFIPVPFIFYYVSLKQAPLGLPHTTDHRLVRRKDPSLEQECPRMMPGG